MFRHLFTPESGMGIFPMISLFIFFAIFLAVLIWVFRMNKSYIRRMSYLPLEKPNLSQEESRP